MHATDSIDPDSITQVVAIDGPAGAGKSTTARRAAAELGFAFLDTGAMYRAATWNALHRLVDLDDPEAVAEATRKMELDMREDNGRQRVIVDGQDVTEAIRSAEVTNQICRLDQAPAVRHHLVALQRAFGSRQPTVAEGRDIGTVVFPRAKCKIFMVANHEERTRRRMQELQSKGQQVEFERLSQEIAERDRKDETRSTAPLRMAPDAHRLDTTGLSLDEVVAEVVRLARAAL